MPAAKAEAVRSSVVMFLPFITVLNALYQSRLVGNPIDDTYDTFGDLGDTDWDY